MALYPPGKAIGPGAFELERIQAVLSLLHHCSSGVMISQHNSLSVCVPPDRAWHTPWTRSMQSQSKIRNHVQHFSFLCIHSMSQAGFWNIPGTKKKFTLVSNSEGSFEGTQFAKQNCTRYDLPSYYCPILPIWLKASAYNWYLMNAPSGSQGVLRAH